MTHIEAMTEDANRAVILAFLRQCKTPSEIKHTAGFSYSVLRCVTLQQRICTMLESSSVRMVSRNLT